jgi:hypothetical protein
MSAVGANADVDRAPASDRTDAPDPKRISRRLGSPARIQNGRPKDVSLDPCDNDALIDAEVQANARWFFLGEDPVRLGLAHRCSDSRTQK